MILSLLAVLIGLFCLFGILVLVVYLVLFRWPRVNEFWQSNRLRFFVRKLLFYQTIGLSLLYLIILSSLYVPSVMELEDVTMDLIMELYRGDIPPREDKNIPHFVLLDIDDNTYKNWDNPLYTPRDRLNNLIDAAVQAKARLIVVDVDVSLAMDNSSSSPYDPELKTYLENCKNNPSACPPIILVRTFKKIASTSVPAISKMSFFEDVVTTDNMQWGTAQFSISDTGMMRRWRLWEPSCTNQQPEVIPSIELLVMSSLIHDCTQEDIQNALAPFIPQDCSANNQVFSDTVGEITVCGLTISTNTRSIEQRIMYRIPWSDGNVPPRLPRLVPDNNGVPILTIFSAQPYAESPPQASLQALTDSIVVIGGSHGYESNDPSCDVHLTPLGDMPGALVIINAIHSLLQDITIKPVSIWKWLTIAALLILLATLFSYFSEQWKISEKFTKKGIFGWKILWWCVVAVIIVGLLYASVVLFEDGTWLNIAIPLLIIQIYRAIYQRLWAAKWAAKIVNKFLQ